MRNLIIVSLLFAIVIYPIALYEVQAGTIFNGTDFGDVNYTNIYVNKTYMDIVKQARDFPYPTRDMDFGISISRTCYQMHKYDIKTDCPTYEAIMALFPDTSDQTRSGKFVLKDNFIQRGRPQMEDHYNYYTFYENKTMLFIDPDANLQKQLSMINIESHLPEYPVNYKVENNTRTMGVGRYIEDCRNAVIDGKNWIFLVGDTMEYMRHDCHDTFTLYNDNKTIYQPKTVFDITTSNKWLHDSFLNWVADNCLDEYDKC